MKYIGSVKNAKLIELLRAFKARDLRRLEQYLESPFFGIPEKLLRFYRVVRGAAPDFSGPGMDKEAIWAAYSPGQPYDEKEMGYLMSFLGQAAEQYLAQDRFEQEPMLGHLFRLEYFVDQGLEKHYRAEYRKAEKWLEAAPHRDSAWEDHAWRLASIEVSSFYLQRSRTPDHSLQQASAHLDAFYFAEKLRLSCELLNQQSILSNDIERETVSGWLDYFVAYAPKDNPEIQLRLSILEMLENPDRKDSFQELLRRMPSAPQYLPPTKVREVYAYAQNYCIRQIKSGHAAFLHDLFEINRQTIDIGLIYEMGEINPWNFKNIVSTALKLGHYDWTESFIAQYQDGLAAQFRPSAIAYNTAHLQFHRKTYDKALRSLMEVSFSDIFYALDTRKLQLMIYFERGDAEPLLSLITSFKVFLRRNRVVSANNREAYQHFVDWVAKIFRETEKKQPDLSVLVPQIHATTPLVDSDWLVKQCGGA